MRYFGFAIADSMFPVTCTVNRKPLTPEEVRTILAEGNVGMALNPSHKLTCEAATQKFGLLITIPDKAPIIRLNSGDSIIVMSVWGLPRLEGRHEYTEAEIASATFIFGEWTVT
jgi:hypothetical protein